MKTLIFITIAILSFKSINAQQSLDGSFSFQTDPNKKYSLYIPSSYNPAAPNKMMLGLHPLNPGVWTSTSWRDTLVKFAEVNQLILVCPDGGTDGAIDDPIDTAFTTALLDSVELWYNIDLQKVYAMGFSWGGRTTYTYGLHHIGRFAGFIPIGAAINNTTEVNGIIQNAFAKPFFIVHGNNDSPSTRFFPIRTALINNGAFVNDTLMPGVGHTINFPGRNKILRMAFKWIDSLNCAGNVNGIGFSRTPETNFSIISPNPFRSSIRIKLEKVTSESLISVYTIDSKQILHQKATAGILEINTSAWVNGIYFLQVMEGNKIQTVELIKSED